ncbi:unnamed protein product [Owenia fusiformis]|uniref:Uncharacterized protein n=1 Tax=Owenia fusiformis TaxID=6347 RepID=A0A8J1U8S4_OWEFU|nr:unnamed protein product [Owenia fusiformis]
MDDHDKSVEKHEMSQMRFDKVTEQSPPQYNEAIQPPTGGPYQPQPGQYQPLPAQYQPPPEQYQPPPGQYQPPPGQYQPPPGQYQPPSGQYQPPPGGMATAQPTPSVPVQQTTVVIQNQQLLNIPTQTICQHCNNSVVTQVEYQSGTCTYIACIGLCLIGCGAGCCLIPFCMDGCKDVLHTCPQCHQIIGQKSGC